MPLPDLPETKGPLAERKDSLGRRKMMLDVNERADMQKSLMLDRLVLMYLDVERRWTQAQMAEELGITTQRLAALTRTEEFEDRWNEHFIELGRDPRIRATQARIAELLPSVFLKMQEAIDSDEVPWGSKVRIMEKVLELSGIEKPKVTQSNRKELEDFLNEKAKEQSDSATITIPIEFARAMSDYKNADVVDGEATVIESDVGSV